MRAIGSRFRRLLQEQYGLRPGVFLSILNVLNAESPSLLFGCRTLSQLPCKHNSWENDSLYLSYDQFLALSDSSIMQGSESNCPACNARATVQNQIVLTRKFLLCNVEEKASTATSPPAAIPFAKTIKLVDEKTKNFKLRGVIYYPNNNHFSCFLITPDNDMFYYDGMKNDGYFRKTANNTVLYRHLTLDGLDARALLVLYESVS